MNTLYSCQFIHNERKAERNVRGKEGRKEERSLREKEGRKEERKAERNEREM